MAVEVALRVGVDLDVDRLSRPHAVELGLLVVRDDPDFVRHEHGEVCARLRILPHRAGEVDDAARLVGDDGRIAEVELRLVALGLRLREARLRRCALRLQRVDLPLRHLERRLRAVDSGLLGLETLDVNRALLSRRPTLIDERLVASPGDLRELQVRLRLGHLRLVRGDLRVLRGDLRVDVVDAGLRPPPLELRPARARRGNRAGRSAAITPPLFTCWLSVTGTAVT